MIDVTPLLELEELQLTCQKSQANQAGGMLEDMPGQGIKKPARLSGSTRETVVLRLFATGAVRASRVMEVHATLLEADSAAFEVPHLRTIPRALIFRVAPQYFLNDLGSQLHPQRSDISTPKPLKPVDPLLQAEKSRG